MSIIDSDGQKVPSELVIEILEWLPVKSLLRFKCVSKWWYELITSPTFINNHLIKGFATTNNTKIILLNRSFQDDSRVISFHDFDSPELVEIRPNLSLSFLKDPQTFQFIGSSNGIVCFGSYYLDVIVLCNPALNQFKQLYYPLDCLQGYTYGMLGMGFGVTCSNEFKVIVMRCIYEIDNEEAESLISIHLYSSSTNLWKEIGSDSKVKVSRYISRVFFNGACHWFRCEDYEELVILCFDINTNVFNNLELPVNLYWSDEIEMDKAYTLIVLDECLAFIQHNSLQSMSEAIEVWVMEEYGVKESWNFKFMIWPYLVLYPFLAWKNDEWLLIQTSEGQLASICLNDCEIKTFEIYGVVAAIRSVIHKDSLVSLN